MTNLQSYEHYEQLLNSFQTEIFNLLFKNLKLLVFVFFGVFF